MVELSLMKKSPALATPTVYGIANCDSVKKARAWMDGHGIDYVFHDFKKQGVTEQALDFWLSQQGWETLLNRKGTTWRKLSPETQQNVTDAATAREVMLLHTSVIKRPVVVVGAQVVVGVNPEVWRGVMSGIKR
jgi:Spx/MgsR family transcriptional regulator